MARVRSRRPKSLRTTRPWRDVPVAVALVLALALGGLVARDASHTAELAAEHEAALGTMEAHFAVSHTWVEEYVIGDPHVDLAKQVYGNQAEAARLCKSLRDGGPAGGTETIEALDDAGARDAPASTCRAMDRFRDLTDERVRQGSAERVGTALEQRYDVAFDDALVRADGLRVRRRPRTPVEHDRAGATEILLVAGLVALLLTAGVISKRRGAQLAALA